MESGPVPGVHLVLIPALLSAATAAICLVQINGTPRSIPCEVVEADGIVSISPVRGRKLPAGAVTITIESSDSPQAWMRILTRSGVNARSDDLLREVGTDCWSSEAKRICTRIPPPTTTEVLETIPADLIGDWQIGDDDACEDRFPDLRIGHDAIVDDRIPKTVVGIRRRAGITTLAIVDRRAASSTVPWRISTPAPDRIAVQGHADVMHRCPSHEDR